MNERRFINKLTAGIPQERFDALGPGVAGKEPGLIRKDAPSGGWTVEPNILNGSEPHTRQYDLSKGIIKVKTVIRHGAVEFDWDGEVADTLGPGEDSNLADFRRLIFEGLPGRVDTEARSDDELRHAFRAHTTVEFGFDGDRKRTYSIGDPIQGQQFDNDFVANADGIRRISVIGMDNRLESDYKYRLSLGRFETGSQQIKLTVPSRRNGGKGRSVSWANVLEWVLTTHTERRRMPDPAAESIYLGEIVHDLITPPPSMPPSPAR